MKNRNIGILFILLTFMGLLSFLFDSPLYDFLYAALLFVLIAFKAKLSFFTELSFILFFSYMQGVIQKEVGSISGSTLAWAGVKMPFYFGDLTIATCSFLLTTFWFVNFTPLLEREKAVYRTKTNLGKFTSILFAVSALFMILMVFPSLPTLSFSEGSRARNDAIPYGLVLLSLVLLGIVFDSVKKQKWLITIYVFVVFWIFGHGERVEVLGFLSFLALKYMRELDLSQVKESLIRNKKRLLYGTGALFVVLAMWIGLKRGGATNISWIDVLMNLIIQPTCGDVVYCFNCAADLWHTGNGLWGYTYTDYLLQLIPGSTSAFSAAEILLKLRNTMGGALFYSEAMMNFGIIGVILSNVEFFIVMNLILKYRRGINEWIWIPITIEVFRIAWYGRSGWILVGFVELPLLYTATKCFFNKVRIR